MARKGKKNDFIDDSDASLGEEEEASEEAAFSAEDGNDSEDVKPKSKKSSSKAAPKAKTVKDKKVKEKDVKPASKVSAVLRLCVGPGSLILTDLVMQRAYICKQKRKASDDDDREQGSSKG